MKNSSYSSITGDIPLSPLKKYLYRLNAFSERQISKLYDLEEIYSIEKFEPVLDKNKILETFGNIALVASPIRLLCMDFLLNHGVDSFGNGCDLIDLGCGTGLYSRHLARISNYRSYEGFDIKARKEWDELSSDSTRFNLATLGVDPIPIGSADRVFSQSVLEHVHYDCSVFDRFLVETPRFLKHLHLVPAPMSFFETRYHGYRRYGGRELKNLLSNPSFQDVTITPIGNPAARIYHKYQHGKLVKPHLARQAPAYDTDLSALENMAKHAEKFVNANAHEASFYALSFTQQLK